MLKNLMAALAVCGLVMAGGSASAGSDPVAKCSAGKRKAAGKKGSAMLGCYAKVIGKAGGAPDSACIAKAVAGYEKAFDKAQSKTSCPGDKTSVENQVDTCVTDLVATTSGETGKCPGGKVKAAGKGFGGEMACYAKEATKSGSFTPCDQKNDDKLAKGVTKADSKGVCSGTLTEIGDIIETCTQAIANATPPAATTTSTTSSTSTSSSTSSSSTTSSSVVVTTTSTSSTTSTTIVACCSAVRISTSSPGGGTLKVGGFQPFPFPPGVLTVIDAGPPDAQCKHDAVVPAGGFVVPPFCIPALQYTSQVLYLGCATGAGLGKGVVWDGHTGAHGGTPLTNVSKVADSSDGVCDTTVGACANQDLNFLGDIDTVRSAGGDPTKVTTRLDLPAHSLTWQDSLGCPGDGVYNPGDGDTLVTQFDFILSPTTGMATGAFVDKNADGCALPGGSAGFGAPSAQCASGAAGPCSASGSPAPGPCCTVGQVTTVATAGMAFSNSFPLYDLGFINVIPSSITGCGTPGTDTCTLPNDPCLGSPSGAFLD